MRYSEFIELNTEILAIDVDTVFSHKVWNEIELSKMVPGGIPYPMLSDNGGKIGKLYDVYDEQKGRTLRGTFIIDHNGYIHGAEVLTSPVGRNTDEILRQIQAFQHYTSTGEAFPANWQPGCHTIKPSITIAGHMSHAWKPKQNNCYRQ